MSIREMIVYKDLSYNDNEARAPAFNSHGCCNVLMRPGPRLLTVTVVMFC